MRSPLIHMSFVKKNCRNAAVLLLLTDYIDLFSGNVLGHSSGETAVVSQLHHSEVDVTAPEGLDTAQVIVDQMRILVEHNGNNRHLIQQEFLCLVEQNSTGCHILLSIDLLHLSVVCLVVKAGAVRRSKILAAVHIHALTGEELSEGSEDGERGCDNGVGGATGGSCCWIIILLLLFCGCGNNGIGGGHSCC